MCQAYVKGKCLRDLGCDLQHRTRSRSLFLEEKHRREKKLLAAEEERLSVERRKEEMMTRMQTEYPDLDVASMFKAETQDNLDLSQCIGGSLDDGGHKVRSSDKAEFRCQYSYSRRRNSETDSFRDGTVLGAADSQENLGRLPNKMTREQLNSLQVLAVPLPLGDQELQLVLQPLNFFRVRLRSLR